MNVLPTADSVFTPQYWEPLPELPAFESHGVIGQILEQAKKTDSPLFPRAKDRDAKKRAREAMCVAVNQLLEGEPAERIEEGELIGGKNDFKNALPGAVILVDLETAYLGSVVPRFVGDSTNIMPEVEVELPAISCLMRNMSSTRFEDPAKNYAVLNDYRKHLVVTGKGYYTREINIHGFCEGKNTPTVGLSMSQWRNEPDSPYVFTFNKYFPYPPAVGETCFMPYSLADVSYGRIREARLLIGGIRQTAAEKARPSRGLLPRLATHLA